MIRSLLTVTFVFVLLHAASLPDAHAGPTKLMTIKGVSFEGQILAGNVNTVTMTLDAGGYTIVPRAEIEQISVQVEDGTTVEGTLHDWQDGKCIIRSGNSLVTVVDGVVTSVAAEQITQPAAAPLEVPRVRAPTPLEIGPQVPPSSVVSNKPTM